MICRCPAECFLHPLCHQEDWTRVRSECDPGTHEAMPSELSDPPSKKEA